jgi:hypothetical protein
MLSDHKRLTYGKWEYVLPGLACVSLIVSCILISSIKLYWNDELFSYYFVSDPSFANMLAAFHDKINNTPLLYFALGWLWDKAFGSAELSLRLFSSLGMCLALLLTWTTLRRTYGFWATSLGTLAVFCTSNVILSQNAEARMYGLFLALSAGAFLLYDRLCRDQEPRRNTLWLNAGVHVALMHTHLFGGFYSGAIMVALFLTDRYFGRFRPRVYLSVVLSWLSILLYLPSFLNQSDAGNPRTWIPTPDLTDLVDFLNLTAATFFRRPFLLVLLGFLGLYLLRKKSDPPTPTARKASLVSAADVPHLLFALGFLVLPVFIWLFAITIKPIFHYRYMIPTALGWAILFAYILNRILPEGKVNFSFTKKIRTSRRMGEATTALFLIGVSAILLVSPVIFANANEKNEFTESYGNLKEHGHLPIAVQVGGAFIESLYHSTAPERYYYVMDWEVAVDEHSGLFSPQEYKHMEAWKRNYPQVFKNVVTSEEFLKAHDRFLVLDFIDYTRKCPSKPIGVKANITFEDIHCPQWLERRLLNNSKYQVTHLVDLEDTSVLLVERQAGGATDITTSAE